MLEPESEPETEPETEPELPSLADLALQAEFDLSDEAAIVALVDALLKRPEPDALAHLLEEFPAIHFETALIRAFERVGRIQVMNQRLLGFLPELNLPEFIGYIRRVLRHFAQGEIKDNHGNVKILLGIGWSVIRFRDISSRLYDILMTPAAPTSPGVLDAAVQLLRTAHQHQADGDHPPVALDKVIRQSVVWARRSVDQSTAQRERAALRRGIVSRFKPFPLQERVDALIVKLQEPPLEPDGRIVLLG
jgi:hypothetical protein